MAELDAVLEYPQSGERIRGRANIGASRVAQPSTKRFTVRRMLGGGDLWISELVLTYDGQPFYVVSIMEFEGGEVVRETQYFSEPFRAGALSDSMGRTNGMRTRLAQTLDDGAVGHAADLCIVSPFVRCVFKRVHESLVTLAASAANLASSSVAALSSLGLSSTTISVDGLT
jgi:hypothetical protein